MYHCFYDTPVFHNVKKSCDFGLQNGLVRRVSRGLSGFLGFDCSDKTARSAKARDKVCAHFVSNECSVPLFLSNETPIQKNMLS